MASMRFDVLGIGNAIVDVIARTDDAFLAQHNMRKGTMQLINESQAAKLYDAMGPAVEVSGGSAANTVVGVASLGARAAFIGKVKDDELGRVFAHDIRAAGVAFATPPASAGPSTARCYVLVTPDGERTMNTYLGAAQDLHPNDIDSDAIAAAQIIYLEGYLWDPPHAKEAFLKAAKIAHDAERDVALTLSDAFCVDCYRAEFLSHPCRHRRPRFRQRARTAQPVRDRRLRHRARCSAQGCAACGDHAQRKGLSDRDARGNRRCSGEPRGARSRRHRRRRPVRRGFSGRALARRRVSRRGAARGVGGRRSDPT